MNWHYADMMELVGSMDLGYVTLVLNSKEIRIWQHSERQYHCS